MSRYVKKTYFMVEIIMALALLALLAACFAASLRVVDKMDRLFSAETRALMVVDNTVERLSHLSGYDAERIRTIFLDECRAGDITGRNGRLRPLFTAEPGTACMVLLQANDKPMIEVKIKCRP